MAILGNQKFEQKARGSGRTKHLIFYPLLSIEASVLPTHPAGRISVQWHSDRPECLRQKLASQ